MNKQTVKSKKNPGINPSLLDTHRPLPRSKGGNYTPDNIEVLTPVEHMKVHGNYREREEALNTLKSLIDAREQLRKTVNSINNRILAVERRTDNADQPTMMFLEEQLKQTESWMGKMDRRITKHLLSMPHEIASKALAIPGVGPITVAYMLAYVDIEKARYASSLWAYVGLDKPSHRRKVKNEAGGGNQTLRTVLYTMATSMEKTQKKNYTPYYQVYDQEKKKLEVSEKVTETKLTGKAGVHEVKWKDVSPGHRRGAAIRKMIKHFLADFWYVWRTVEGLDTPMLYPEAKLGHKGIVKPEERGWDY